MSQVLSKFVFITPPTSARNKGEFDSIIAHRRAFNIVLTARLIPVWQNGAQLLEIQYADLTQLYVIYKFAGDVYVHLSQLKCRIISPLVVLQSHKYRLVYPMRTSPTWAQSLRRKIVCAIGFSEDDENEIRDKVIRLGGHYKKTISKRVALILVNTFNRDDPWIQTAADNSILILSKEWLDKVHQSAINLEQDCAKFFGIAFLEQHQVTVSTSSIEQPVIVSQQINQQEGSANGFFQSTPRSKRPVSESPPAIEDLYIPKRIRHSRINTADTPITDVFDYETDIYIDDDEKSLLAQFAGQ